MYQFPCRFKAQCLFIEHVLSPLKPLHNLSSISSVTLIRYFFFPLPRNRMGAGGRAGVYFLKCPLMQVPEHMTRCERKMEGESEDEERNGGEVNYKLVDSPRASPSLQPCMELARGAMLHPVELPRRQALGQVLSLLKHRERRHQWLRGRSGDSSLQDRRQEQI